MSPRTGRPKSEKAKSTQIAVRFDYEDLERLDACVEKYQVTRAEAVRMAVRFLYSDIGQDK